MCKILSQFLVLMAVTCFSLMGQITGDLEVRATDATGGAIANADVVLKNVETGAVREAKTDNQGAIRITLLNTGRYEVRISAKGFATLVTQAEVTIGSTRELKVALEVASTRQEVMVEESTVAINTVSSQLQTATNEKAVSELPLSTLGPLGLAGTTPGVIPVTPRNAFLGLGSYNSNGGRGRGNNITVDSAVSSDVSTTGGAGLGTIPEFLIREVSVISNNFAAEFGRNANSQFQIITKSGTNDFHGQAWEFFRNDKMNSRDYFDRTGRAPILRDNRWGGYFGGPVVKNRFFVLGHYEQQKVRGQGATRVASVWTPAQVAAITDPTSRSLFQQLKGDQFTSPTGTITTTSPLATDSVAGSIRGDWNISTKDTLFARWAIQDVKQRSASLTFVGGNLPTGGAGSVNRPQNGTINYTRTWSPTLVQNALASFGRSRPGFAPLESFGGPQIGFSNLAGTTLGSWPGIPQGRVQNVYQYFTTFTLSKNAHLLKWGYNFERVQANSYFDSNVRGTWTFPSFEAFAAGTPALYTQRFGNSVRGNRVSTQSMFFQDDWKIRRNLTLNLGMRLEIAGGVSEVNDILSNLNLDKQISMGAAGSGPLGGIEVVSNVFNTNYNWAPRVGLAWNPGGGRTAIRAGYGIAYDFIFLNPITNLRFAPPFMYQFSNTAFTGNNTYARLAAGTSEFQQVGNATVGSFGSVRNFGGISPVDQALRNPQVHQWNFTVEREQFGMLMRASYIGTKSNFLQRTRPINTIAPTNAITPAQSAADEAALLASGRLASVNAGLNAGPTLPSNRIDSRFLAVGMVESSANSNYHGLQAYIAKRFSKGIAFTSSYTLGKSIDDVSDVLNVVAGDTPNQQNPFNNRDNRGPSGFDVRHRFVATHNWEIPFFRNSSNSVLKAVLGGWALNGIYQWQSGLPIGLLSGVRTGYSQFPDPLFLGGGGAQRPNLVGPLNLSLGPDPGTGAQNPNKVTNSGLAQPFIGNFGSLGRNVVRQNGLMQYDVTALKDFAITERFKLQLQGQFFNLFNNTSFQSPGATLFSPTNFGYYQDTATNTRNITVVLRLMF